MKIVIRNMKFISISILVSIFSISCYSQNLIINGDFENYDTLPDLNGQVQRALPWHQISRSCDYWYNSIWTPWFDNSLTSKSGKGFSGIGNSSNGLGCETFGQTILSPLEAGNSYLIGAYCKNGSNTTWTDTCSKLSIYGFITDPLVDTMMIRPTNIPNVYFLGETNTIGNQSWELKMCTFTAPANLNYIAISLNGNCSQYVLIDSIFCYKVDKQITDTNNCNYFIPSAFSPNGDGKNDYFKPYIKCDFNEYNMKIYNRWGELVFHSENININWNGYYKASECEIGTYFYILTFKNNNLKQQVLKGDIVLIK